MKLTTGFRLSDAQVDSLKASYREIDEKLKENQLEGMIRLVARQEALQAIYNLHKVEVKRLEELGDNAALADFIQSKEF